MASIKYIIDLPGGMLGVAYSNAGLYAPLIIHWEIAGRRLRSRIWKLDNILLMKKGVINQVQKEISLFFQTNSGTTDRILLWETFNTYICGVLMSESICKKGKV